MTNEVELKLRIEQSDIPSLKRHLATIGTSTNIQISTPTTHKTLSRYYDTPDLTLLDHGLSLRLRHAGRKWTQTIKDAGNVLSGLHQRLELEWDVKAGGLDFSKITDPTHSAFFNNASLRDGLAPIFSTDMRRTTWVLAFENTDKIELVLDVGEIIAGNNREPICEIELELIEGNKGRLFAFALQLQKHIPLFIENISKAQRAYAYFRAQPVKTLKAEPIKLHKKALANETLKQIVQACLIQLQANQDVVLYGRDVEGVHQMRIALRRLRSALKIFSRVIHKQSCEHIINDLVWITNVLGHARDLDVLITQTLPPIMTQMPNQPSLTLLLKKAIQERKSAYGNVRAAITNQRYQHLLLALGDWLENHLGKDVKTKKMTVAEIAQPMLTKCYQQLKNSGENLKKATPDERHRTRILAKKLRYLAEFFASLYPSKRTNPFIKSLAQLQDQLGTMNDISVTSGVVKTLLGEKPSKNLNTAKHLIDGWNARGVIPYITEMKETWKLFSKQKPFW